MRISKGALLVVLALVAPVLVELRTVLAWFGVELTVLQTALLGVAIVVTILVWAFLPEDDEDEAGGNGTSPGHDLTNGD